MFNKFLGITVSATLLAGAASATTFNIDGFVNSSAGGFTSTLFHEASGCNAMCGASIVKATGTGSGSWNDVTGDISFVMDLVGGGTASVVGLLNFAGIGGAYIGSFTTTFAGTSAYSGTHDIKFLDEVYNAAQGVNAFQNGIIGLWGAAGGNPASNGMGFDSSAYLGSDFRIEVSPIPLPASGLLLLSALGGIGFLGRRRNSKVEVA